MSKPSFAEHKERYERSEIYKMAFLLYSYTLICYRSAIPILRRFVKFQT